MKVVGRVLGFGFWVLGFIAWGDGVEAACKAGVSVIAQPGGSMRDQDAIDCCNKYGVTMLFTGVRHFKH